MDSSILIVVGNPMHVSKNIESGRSGLITLDKNFIKLLNYCLKENHLPSAIETAATESLVLLISGAGVNYIPLAIQNAVSFGFKLINGLTTGILGVLVLYLAAKDYIQKKIWPQFIPEKLKDIISAPLERGAFFRQMSIQLILAAFSAIPLAFTIFDAKVSFLKKREAFWTTFSYYLFANTVLHLLPIELTLNHPLYGLPPRAVLFLAKKCFPCCFPPPRPLTEVEIKVNNLYKKRGLIAKLLAYIKPLFLKNFQKLSDEDRQALLESSAEELFEKMLKACDIILLEGESFESRLSTLDVSASSLDPKVKVFARGFGILSVLCACLGYAASPYLVFTEQFKMAMLVAIAIVIAPIYFFMLLMAYFGDGMGVSLFQDSLWFVRQIMGQEQASDKRLLTEGELYFLFNVFSCFVSFFIAAFAGAPAREMSKQAFDSRVPAWFMIFLQGMACIGIGMLGFYAPRISLNMMLGHYAQYVEANEVVIMSRKIDDLIAKIQQITISPSGEQDDNLIDIDNVFAFCEQVIKEKGVELNEKQEPSSYLFDFFSSCKKRPGNYLTESVITASA